MTTMVGYPKELRERVVAAVEQGEYTIAEIANMFSVGVTFVKMMLKLHREGEHLASRHDGGPVRLLGKKELAEFKDHADATLEELQKLLVDKAQVTASLPTICRALQDLNLPLKNASLPTGVTKKNAANFRR